jgi:hypothetical protein
MMRARLVALTSLSLFACPPSERKPTPPMTEHHAPTAPDDELVARIRAAVAARTPAPRLAAFVGQAPLIDTTAGSSLLALQRVEFAQDPDHPADRLDRARARALVYWRRPLAGDDPHVVGVEVDDTGTPRLFFAIILPPG